MDDAPEIAVVRRSPRRGKVQDWALALAAEGIASRISAVAGSFELEIAAAGLERASQLLEAYDRENAERETRPRPTAPPPFSPAGFMIGGLLLAFFLITGERDATVAWFAKGAADAEAILAGEWWRTVTALTLHADLRHVLSNAVSGTLFIGAVCGALGVGFGSALVLLAGALGNWLNAVFHGANHASVGASTAVFAAIGILSARAFAARRRHEPRTRRAWLAFGAGLALIAMLGTGGERVDVWAHLFGWIAGAALALPFVTLRATAPAAFMQAVCALAAAATLAACWTQALY